jgi:hypothetical protein
MDAERSIKPAPPSALSAIRELFAHVGDDPHAQIVTILAPPGPYKTGVTSRTQQTWFASPDRTRGGWVIWCDPSAANPESSRQPMDDPRAQSG